MKRILSAICALALLLSGAAMAAKAIDTIEPCIYLTGDANVRIGPGLEHKGVDVAKKDSYRSFLFDMSIDERGVAWYYAGDGDTTGWISSKYGQLQDAEGNALTYVPEGAEVVVWGEPVLLSSPSEEGYEVVAVPEDDFENVNFACFSHEGEKAWYYVEYRGYEGWLSEDCCELQYN